MTRHPVYVCAPYGDADAAIREINTRRAELLAQLAVREGLAPICIHSLIQRGVLGDDGNAAHRAAGLDVATALLLTVRARVFGKLWILTRDDGGTTEGMDTEMRAWRHGAGPRLPLRSYTRIGTWDDWHNACKSAGLDEQWQALTEVTT